jgi:mono/diheme cytochrome c family protein
MMRSSLMALVLVAAIVGVAAAQQKTDKPAKPFAPEWAQFAGWDVFTSKGCGKCHRVRGVGGAVGPDLGRIKTGKSFFDIGADLWNHLPKMGAKMREVGVERPTLTPRDAANVIAFLFTAQYMDESGNAASGEKLFASKGCARCHAVGDKSDARVGPNLDRIKRASSPVVVAATMWNHGPEMTLAMKWEGVPRPTLEGKELLDIVAYVQSVSKDTGETEQVVPGTPERGHKIFVEKKCATCHAVGGKGPRVGPDLGTSGHHVSLTEFAARMWNHQPAMLERMKQRAITPPKLTGQEMADVLAYLYVSRYFESEGKADRGRALAQDKGCLGCHSVRGVGEKVGADFARSQLVRTPSGLVAGMWNHSGLMERAAEKRSVAWPALTGQELADLSAYFVSLSAGAPKARGAK